MQMSFGMLSLKLKCKTELYLYSSGVIKFWDLKEVVLHDWRLEEGKGSE